MVEHLLCECDVPSSNPSPIKKGGGVRIISVSEEEYLWLVGGLYLKNILGLLLL
jgi:hypothetical protein